MKKPEPIPWGREAIGLAVCIGLHVAADLLLIRRTWFLDHEQVLVAVSLPLSQVSLAALWTSTSRATPYLRFAVPPCGTVACWFVLTRILPWGIGDPASAAWALALTVQTLAIIFAVHLYRLVPIRQAHQEADGAHPIQSRLTFNLLTLMLCTTVAALAFGFVQYGRVRWGWTLGVIEWEYFDFMPIVGAYNALLALLWLWVIAGVSWWWRFAKAAIVFALIAPLAYVLSSVDGLIGSRSAMDFSDALIFTAGQCIFIACSLAIVFPTWRQNPIDLF